MNLLLLGAYGLANQDDFDAFTKFIKDLTALLPLPFKVNLGPYIEKLFDAHLGIPAYAVKTIIRAVIACACDGCKSWKDEYVWNALPSLAEYETIATETLEGEQNITPYLSSPNPIAYPTEAELLAVLAERKTRMVGDAARGFRR
jgi:hypothetical protein